MCVRVCVNFYTLFLKNAIIRTVTAMQNNLNHWYSCNTDGAMLTVVLSNVKRNDNISTKLQRIYLSIRKVESRLMSYTIPHVNICTQSYKTCHLLNFRIYTLQIYALLNPTPPSPPVTAAHLI